MEGRILIVEDSNEMSTFLKIVLGEKYIAATAATGIEGLEMLRAEPFDLVISDVVMPEMDGFGLCEAIKADLNLSHIPVILLTAKRSAGSTIEGLEKGADVYLEKPVSADILLAQVASLLGNRKRVREFFVRSPWAQISSIAHTSEDERFLSSLNDVIQAHLQDPAFDVDLLATTLNMSRATLYRKVKAVAEISPVEFINVIRLKKAAALLTGTQYKVHEVAKMTGFNSLSSFSRNFFKQFGLTPAEYAKTSR